MRFFARAGLVVVSIAALVILGSAAPIPVNKNCESSLEPCAPNSRAISQQTFALDQHALSSGHIIHRTTTSSDGGVSAREVEMVVLVRRKSIFTKMKEAFQRLGHGIKHVFQKIGSGIKHVAQKIGSGIKKVAQKIGHGIKVAAQKVGHFIKATGAKIAKVGLKIVSTIGKAVGKIVGFIPGVGKVLGKAIDGASEGLNAASNAIHAKIGGKLGRAMRGMDKAQKIEGYIPRGLPEDYEDLYLRAYDLGDWEDLEY